MLGSRSSYGPSPAAGAATWRQPRGSPDTGHVAAAAPERQQEEEENEGDTVLRGDGSSTSGGHVAAAGHRRSASLDRFKTAADKTISGGGAASPLALAAALTSGGRHDLNAFNTNQLARTPGGGVSSPDRKAPPGSRHPSKRALHEAMRSKRSHVSSVNAFLGNAEAAAERRYGVAWVSRGAEAALQHATMGADASSHPAERCELLHRALLACVEVSKRNPLEQFLLKNDQFTKTGSGDHRENYQKDAFLYVNE
eukprot:COSAG06_NODE_253_length_19061_cov_33.083114_16_plen_254_part_00